MTALLVASGTALAVHEGFQLDGDVDSDTTTSIGGTTQTIDWDAIFDADGEEISPLPTGFTDAAFERDFRTNTNGSFNTGDGSTFATGSKDTLPISGWQCNQDNNVNSKIDVINAYTVATTSGGDELLYFALERNVNTGTANVGFWFLQDAVGCESTGGAVNFSGEHKDGDVLVVSEFTNGGVVSTIQVYRWDRTNGDADCLLDPVGPDCEIDPVGVPGFLNPNAIGEGVDCRAGTTLPFDSACGAANTTDNGDNGTITTPWLTANKQDGVGHLLRTSEFFEGGINLTELDLGGQCFSAFLADTRSSTSLTATLFDFAGGTVGSCTAAMTTTPSQTTRLISSTDAITDTATITGSASGGGTGTTPTGAVDFFLCAPSELTPADTGICAPDDGTAVTGNPVAVAESVPGTATATSGDAQDLISGLGKYCFRATFTGTGDYAGQVVTESNSAAECFTVTGSTSLTTDQNWVPNDSATITGDSALSGTATFDLFHSSDCTGTSLYTANVPVSGTSPQTVSTSNTNTVVVVDGASEGNYSWRVSYNDLVLADTAASCTEVSNITITE